MLRYYKYPFLVKISDLEINIEDKLYEEVFTELYKLFSSNQLKPVLLEDFEVSQAKEKDMIAKFAISKLVLSFLDTGKWNKFSVYVSKRVKSYLSYEKDFEEAVTALTSFFKIRYIKDVIRQASSAQKTNYLVHYVDYIKYAPLEIEYALGLKVVHNKNVYLNEHEFVRLLEAATKKHVYDSINLLHRLHTNNTENLSEDLVKKAKEYADRLKLDLFSKNTYNGVAFNQNMDYPPCVQKLLERLSNSENLNHNSRWYLALFLLKKGVEDNKIVQLFSNAPDFNEQITTYQVQFIKKKNYSVPNCEHIKSMSLCVADCKIKNPLQYRKKK
ncbi:MAG: hypothetical protein N3E37_03995 [Candidatus Micrarchaeota archaeon]|nr:hypothetical protein [Candidatus Micrarchaeota archaeon]